MNPVNTSAPRARSINRRTFTAGALALAAAPFTARAQAPARTYRIALWHTAEPVSNMVANGNYRYHALLQELRRLGLVEGRNLIVDHYSGEGRTETYPSIARTIVASNPDVIIPNGDILSRLVMNLTSRIPIVCPGLGDPAGTGLVQSLARPGSNLTGFTVSAGNQMLGLRLQILKEMVPNTKRLAYLATQLAYFPDQARVLRESAAALEVEFVEVVMSGVYDEANYRGAFGELVRRRVDAVLVSGSSEHTTHRQLVVDLAAASRLPTMYAYRDFTEVGGLISYGPNNADNYRKAAGYTVRILNGEKPGDLPVQQPTVFDFIVNLKTAKALGMTIPETIMIRATEVIE
jgi:putative tryptophan/tyrosine transport system substrate-binding protein